MNEAPKNIVDATALASGLSDGWVPIDCRFQLTDPAAGFEAYRQGHIPGARFADLDRTLSSTPGPKDGRHPLPDPAALAGWLGHEGISKTDFLVAYDDAGGAFAARFWWLMRWIGHPRVAVLSGGLPAWTDHGFSLSQDISEPSPAAYELGSVRWDWVVDTGEVLALVDQGRVLVDARAPERYSGAEEPLDPVGGHIPGAVNYPFQGNLSDDGRFLSPATIRDNMEALVRADSAGEVVAMCGSGVTACHLLLAMAEAGLPEGRLYAGSWSEWVRDPDRPVATGAG